MMTDTLIAPKAPKVKPLFTSPLLRLRGNFWQTRSHYANGNNAGMQLCSERMAMLWNLDSKLPIRVGLSRIRVPNSFRLSWRGDLDWDRRIKLEGYRHGELLLISDDLTFLLSNLMDDGDVFVYVDIIE